MDIVTTCGRPDLKDEADAAFRVKWPEFLFPHDPMMIQYEAKVVEFFPQYDVLMLDEGRVVAGGWGVPIRWDGTVQDLPDGYDATMIRAVDGHLGDVAATTLSYMTVAVVNGMTKRGLASRVLTALRCRAVDAGVVIAGDMLSDVEIPLLDLRSRSRDPLGDYEIGLSRIAFSLNNPGVTLIPGHGSIARGDQPNARVLADQDYLEDLRSGQTTAIHDLAPPRHTDPTGCYAIMSYSVVLSDLEPLRNAVDDSTARNS